MPILAILGNRFVLVALALGVALLWHYTDKAAAVRNAEQALADRATIAAQKAEIAEATRRANIAERANEELEQKAAEAARNAEQATLDLDEYAQTTTVDASCIVSKPLIDRLRAR